MKNKEIVIIGSKQDVQDMETLFPKYLIEKKNICNLVKNEKLDMTLLISNANNLGKKIGIFPIHEYWKDVGSPIDYELVNIER